VLFLVDRIELENQAIDAFREIFKNQYFIDSVKSNDWQKCQIVVSTIQTLMA
jgi:type I restriction enzyme R subunit